MALKNIFGKSAPRGLPPALASRLAAWQALKPPSLTQSHFHTRYVAVDVGTSGLEPGRDQLLALAAVGIQQGRIRPDDAFFIQLTPDNQVVALVDFLAFTAKAPLVTFQAPFVEAFVEVALARELHQDFGAVWLDLVNLLPELFRDRLPNGGGLDAWLASFEIVLPGRQEAFSDALALARLFQRVLAEAGGRALESPSMLLDLARARRWLLGDK